MLKQLMEEIHATEIAPASGAEGFESANEMKVHRLRTQSQISLLHNNFQGKLSLIEPGITSGGEDLMSNLNFFDETSAFNNFNNKLKRNESNQPSFLNATESDIDVKGQGEEFDLDEIENMFQYDLSNLEKRLSNNGIEVGTINNLIQDKFIEALAAGSDKNGWVGRDHAPSGFDLESQVAESMRHYNDVLRDDLINHNRQDNEGDNTDSDKDHVSLGEYTISDAELK